jgi:hypothetical protein
VPFHIPTIPRPQDVYRIVVDNTSKPFQHAFLEQSDDGARPLHPLVSVSACCEIYDKREMPKEQFSEACREFIALGRFCAFPFEGDELSCLNI